MLKALKGFERAFQLAGLYDTSVEFRVSNSTDAVVAAFGVLRIASPLNPHEDNPDAFLYSDFMEVTTPSPDDAFVVMQGSTRPGEIASGRAMGLTRVMVQLNDTSDLFAGPGITTNNLESAP